MDERVGYYAQGGGHSIYFTAQEMVMALDETVLRIRFVGAKATPPLGAEKTTAKVNYFVGNDAARWRTDVPTYGQVVYRKLYPGIDLRYGGRRGALKYTFVVNPGADVSPIRLAYGGAAGLRLDEEGHLLILAGGKELKDTKPYAYQEIGGRRVEVEVAFVLHGVRTCGFVVQGDCDPRYPLVIDPVLAYSTYLGGSNIETGRSIVVDGAGQAYVTGETYSTDFPTQSPYDNSLDGSLDAFVTKIDTTRSGTASLVYSTYLGGSGSDSGHGVAVDGAGNAYVTGVTSSTDFPTQNAYQGTYGGHDYDAFFTKLNAAGDALIYSTYLGGSDKDYGYDIAVDGAGHAYVTGDTWSSDFPTQNAYQETFGGYGLSGGDAFVTRIDPTQVLTPSMLLYSTYLGGSTDEKGLGIAVDATGRAYVTGMTESINFPTKTPYQGDQGDTDAFFARIDTTQSYTDSLTYSTYLGGSGDDEGASVAVDEAAHAYVTGKTWSTDFPTQNAYDNSLGGSNDAFFTKIDLTQVLTPAMLFYSTYLGGSGNDEGVGVAIDGAGHAYLTGSTASTDFPTKNPYQGDQGDSDAFVARIDPTQVLTPSMLVYSTYLGGSGVDLGQDIAVDEDGNAYVTGQTASNNFPIHNSYKEVNVGNDDAFVSKLSTIGLAIAKRDFPDPVEAGRVLNYTIVVSATSSTTGAADDWARPGQVSSRQTLPYSIVVTDTVPADTTCCAYIGQGGAFISAKNTVDWLGLSIAAGQSITLTFGVTVNHVPSGTVITNDDYGTVVTGTAAMGAVMGNPVTTTVGTPTNVIVNINTGETFNSIQEALAAALAGDWLLIYPGTYTETIVLTRAVSLHGWGAGQTILKGKDPGPVFTFEGLPGIAHSSDITWTTFISGFTIIGGRPVGGGVTALADGGGIYVNNTSPSIINNTVQDNNASSGGGIYVNNGGPLISNNTVEGNTSDTGGGIYVDSGNPTISNNTVEGNNSDTGGGIYVNSGTPNISNNIVEGNTVTTTGGGIYIGSGSPAVSNNVVQGNSATTGGGIYVDSGANPTVMSNNTLCGNTNFNLYKNGGSLAAPGNWWGSSTPISGTDYNANVNPAPPVSPQLTAEPRNVSVGETATLTITLRANGYKAADGTVISLTVSGGAFPAGLTTVALSTTNGLAGTTVTVTSTGGAIVRAMSACNSQEIAHIGVGPSRIHLPTVLKEASP